MADIKQIHQRLKPELEAMNEIITSALTTDNAVMNDIVTRYLSTKGKQLRPMLVILSARMFGPVNDRVLHAGAALELLHNATLIHDDVVDETELRRNQATINARMGNYVAVLVGDFFVSNALSVGIRTGSVDVVESLSNLGKELSLGEIDQLTNAQKHKFDIESYMSMIRQKTASLFMNCVKMGAMLGGAEDSQMSPLVRFAELLGLCFQIKDDIFDYYENPQIGKPTGNDLREGKVTLPLLYALGEAPQEESARCRELITRGNLTDAEISGLVEFAKRHGGVERSFSKMREMQREAEEILKIYPDSDSRRAFYDMFDFIISRDR